MSWVVVKRQKDSICHELPRKRGFWVGDIISCDACGKHYELNYDLSKPFWTPTYWKEVVT